MVAVIVVIVVIVSVPDVVIQGVVHDVCVCVSLCLGCFRCLGRLVTTLCMTMTTTTTMTTKRQHLPVQTRNRPRRAGLAVHKACANTPGTKQNKQQQNKTGGREGQEFGLCAAVVFVVVVGCCYCCFC